MYDFLYNWWDDRTLEVEYDPCIGCEDYQDGHCISNGGCAGNENKEKSENVKTNIGSIPFEDFLDIKARQSGFEDYGDMKNNGCFIDFEEE